ncbi:MAG: type III-B CRISPR module-associated protein Cmr3, partial [Candidatus Pacearchaeota archaeon]
MGSSHTADSIFPPKPSVFAGFIRSKVFIDNWAGDESKTWERVREIIGDNKDNNYGKLQIKAIFLKKENEYYLPVPLDLVKEKRGDKVGTLVPQDFSNKFSYSTNIELKEFPFIPKDIKFAENVSGFISFEKMKKYLCGESISKEDIMERKDFVELEPRVGIKIKSKTNTVEEEKLYSANFLRFKKDCGFVVLYEGVDIGSQNGDYYLGGEKRQVYFKNLDNAIGFDDKNLKEKISKNKKFKVILITPLEMEDKIEPLGLKEKLTGKAEFVTTVYKIENIGGWDIAE